MYYNHRHRSIIPFLIALHFQNILSKTANHFICSTVYRLYKLNFRLSAQIFLFTITFFYHETITHLFSAFSMHLIQLFSTHFYLIWTPSYFQILGKKEFIMEMKRNIVSSISMSTNPYYPLHKFLIFHL